jgi:hypothetical protein
MEEAGEEEKGRGAPGLETSSKLLEPSVKETWGGPCSYDVLGREGNIFNPFKLAICMFVIKYKYE